MSETDVTSNRGKLVSFHLLTEERLIPSAPPLVILTTSPGAQSLPHQVGYIKRAITLGDTVRSHYPVKFDSFHLEYTTVTLILHTLIIIYKEHSKILYSPCCQPFV